MNHAGRKYSTELLAALLITIMSYALTGCATQHKPPLANAIFVDHDGAPVKPTKDEFTEEPDFDRHLKLIGDAIKASGKKKILIFVHGGLNTLDDGLTRSKAISAIKSEPEHYFPIFVNWDSGFGSTYWEHLSVIRQGLVEPVTGALTLPAVFLEDAGRMVTRFPLDWFELGDMDFKSLTFPRQPYSSGCPEEYEHYLHPEIQAVNALTCTLTEGYRNGKPQTVNISLGKGDVRWTDPAVLGSTALYWLTFPLKYASIPIIDGFGRPAWDNMVRRTKTMYRCPDELDIRDEVRKNHKNPEAVRKVAKEATVYKETGALARLLHALNDVAAGGIGEEKGVGIPRQTQSTSKNGQDFEVTLIGHSMGTIVLNEFIRDYESYPNLKITDIVYMAAACSIRDFERSIIPYMRSPKGMDARFYNLTLHPLNDAREANAFNLVARGSLLEWIDSYFTTPSTPMDRTLGKWENIIQATHIIPNEVRNRVYIKGFPVGETEKDGPQKHGEFADYRPEDGQTWKFWDRSFWEVKAREGAKEAAP